MKKDERRGTEGGITLIALVITIIVLLILAGITISLTLGENGLLRRAEQGKEAHERGEQNDINALDRATDYMNKYFTGTSGEMTLVEMYDKAVAENCRNEDGTCTDETHLHIGDYVDYENPKTGRVEAKEAETGVSGDDQIFEVASNQLNWRVLGKDEVTGGIKLISGRPIKSNNTSDPYLHLKGAKAYINGETILKNIGKMYENKYAQEGRSVNQNDIDEVTGITTTEKINEVNLDPQNRGKAYGEPYSFSEHYTPQSWINGQQKTTVEGNVTGYYYSINSSETPTVRVTNGRIYNMLFDHVQVGRQAPYWLASRGVVAYSDAALFGLGVVRVDYGGVLAGTNSMFLSVDGGGGVVPFGVRPVIILKSNVQKSEVPKIGDKVEEVWNFGGGSGEPQ